MEFESNLEDIIQIVVVSITPLADCEKNQKRLSSKCTVRSNRLVSLIDAALETWAEW